MLFLHTVLRKTEGKHAKPKLFATVLRKTNETCWKVMVWEIVFAHGPEENRAKPISKWCFCTRSLGKQTDGKHAKPTFFATVLRKTEETYWIVIVWKIVFVHGPRENRATPIPKCCFCTRSLGKQTESMRNLNFLQRSLGKQMKPIEKSWFGKSFLLTVLRKTEQNLWSNIGFARGP